MSAAVARVISMEDHRQSAPQLENGFLRVALEIEDALLLKIDTFRHEKVVRAIIRKTYGYNKKEDDITISQIAEMVGIHRNHVGKALRELEEMRVINPVRAGRYGLILGLNKRHHEWKRLEKNAEASKPNQLTEATKTVDEAINQNSCSEQPNQLIEATKTVDFSNQNVAHNRQPQKTTPIDNPKRIAQSADRAASPTADAAFADFWEVFGHKKGKANAKEAFARELAKADHAADWLQTVMAAAAKEAQRRPHLIADGQTPIYAQGWLTQRRYEDEGLLAWGSFSAEQQAFIDCFNANIGDTCPQVTEWTEKRAALCDIAMRGKWGLERWAEFWRYVRDECAFGWPVSFEWMLNRENWAKVKGGQYLSDGVQA
jgi:phage replication O-like protein O